MIWRQGLRTCVRRNSCANLPASLEQTEHVTLRQMPPVMLHLVEEFPLTHRQHLSLFPRGRHIRHGKHGRSGKGSVTNKTTTTHEFFLFIHMGGENITICTQSSRTRQRFFKLRLIWFRQANKSGRTTDLPTNRLKICRYCDNDSPKGDVFRS